MRKFLLWTAVVTAARANEISREVELLSSLVSNETPQEIEQEVDAVIAYYERYGRLVLFA